MKPLSSGKLCLDSGYARRMPEGPERHQNGIKSGCDSMLGAGRKAEQQYLDRLVSLSDIEVACYQLIVAFGNI